MDRLLLMVVLLMNSPLVWGMDLYGGLTELFSYESSIPCESSDSSCDATNGVMGYALDQASLAGLEISNIEEKSTDKKNPEVFIVSKNYGVCRVETKNLQQLGTLGFLCSSVAQQSKTFKKVDRILSLTKKDDSYALLDLTNNTKIKGSLQ